MGWQKGLLSALFLTIPCETLGLPSGSPSFTHRSCNSNPHCWQMFQLVTQDRRQDYLVTVASSRDFTCHPCNGKMVQFYPGFLTVVVQHCPSLLALPLAPIASVVHLLGSPVFLDPNQFLLEDCDSCLFDRSCSEFHACSLTITFLI